MLNRKVIVAIVTFSLAFLGIYTFALNGNDDTTAPIITLTGDDEVTIKVGGTYNDAGATAMDDVDGDLTEEIKVVNDVDVDSIGTYEVTYNVSDAAGNAAEEVVRIVYVVDEDIPLISLLGNAIENVEVGTSYDDDGATAVDNVDGDISGDIVTDNPVNINVVGSYTVTYNVTDSNDNAAEEVTRIVNVVDTTDPVITLLGGADIDQVIDLGDSYLDPGATVIDNYDQEIAIETSNEVDNRVAGVYVVTYIATDGSGNTTTEERTVTVRPLIEGEGEYNYEIGDEVSIPQLNLVTNLDEEGTLLSPNNPEDIDYETIGTYELRYNYTTEDGAQALEKILLFNVEDTTQPEFSGISFDGGETIEPWGTKEYIQADKDSTYEDTAIIYTNDNATGEVTVENKGCTVDMGIPSVEAPNTYSCEYTITDANGNERTTKRYIVVKDTTQPEFSGISFDGGETIEPWGTKEYIQADKDSTYEDTAIIYTNDNATGEVTVKNEGCTVDMGIPSVEAPNTYSCEYTITDANGNAKNTRRYIVVEDTTQPEFTGISFDNGETILPWGTYEYIEADKDSTYEDTAIIYTNDNATGEVTVKNEGCTVDMGVPSVDKPNTYSCEYTITDANGNEKNTRRYIVVEDTTSPIINLDLEGSIIYSKSYTVIPSVSDVSEIVELKYAWSEQSEGLNANNINNVFDNETEITKTDGSGIYYLWIYAKDQYNNEIIQVSNAFYIDNDQPIVEFATNGTIDYVKRTSTTVTVSDLLSGVNVNQLKYTWSPSDDTPNNLSSGTAFENGETINTPADTTGTYYLWIYAKDKAGNVNKVGSNAFYLDNDKPTIEFATNGTIDYVKRTSTTVTVSDLLSGVNVNQLKYTWSPSDDTPNNLSSGTAFENGETINTPADTTGTYYLWIYAKDKVGNVSKVGSNAFYLDNDKPTIEFETNGTIDYVKGTSTVVAVSDLLSGVNVNQLKYTWSPSDDTPNNLSSGTAFENGETINTPADTTGTYYLWIYAKDKVGNVSKVGSNAFYLDNSGPLKPVVEGNGYINGEWTNQNINLNFISADNESGIAKYQWSTVADNNRDTWFDVSNPRTISWDLKTTYYVRAVDNLGNISDFSEPIVIKSDRTKPQVRISEHDNNKYAQGYNAYVEVTDIPKTNVPSLGSGIGQLKYIWSQSSEGIVENDFTGAKTFEIDQNNEAIIPTDAGLTGIYYLWVLVKDNAGNATITNSDEYFLDNEAPVITLLGNSEVTIEQADVYVDAGVTVFDNVDEDIANSLVTVNPVDTSIIGDYTITYNVTDKSGNDAIEVTRIVHVVDLTAPTLRLRANNQFYEGEGIKLNTTEIAAVINDRNIGKFYINGKELSQYEGEGWFGLNWTLDEGEYTFKAVDKYGNFTEQNFEIDLTKPFVKVLEADNEIASGSYVDKTKKITVNASDKNIGKIYINGVEYQQYEGDSWYNINWILQQSTTETNTIVLEDTAGNLSDEFIIKLDLTPPRLRLRASNQFYEGENIILNTNNVAAVINDEHIGKFYINGKELTQYEGKGWFGLSWTLNEGNYTFKAVDKYGNFTELSFIVDYND